MDELLDEKAKPYDGYWISPCGTQSESRPDWHHSVDALLAKGGPVEWCEERVYVFEIRTDEVILYDTSWDDGYHIILAFNVFEYTGTLVERIASALFEACYKAMGGME